MGFVYNHIKVLETIKVSNAAYCSIHYINLHLQNLRVYVQRITINSIKCFLVVLIFEFCNILNESKVTSLN
jgi:hypothetical protein